MNESAYKWIVVTFGLLLLGVVALWLYSRYSEIRTGAIERQKTETADYLTSRVSAMVDPAVFSARDSIQQRRVFQSFFDSIQSRELSGLKVWDRNLRAIWSNLGESVQRQSTENRKVREALGGEVGFVIERQKPGQASESQVQERYVTYVPISDAKGDILGVVAVYQPTLLLHEEIRSEFNRAALPVGAVMFIGYGMLVILLHILMTPKSASPAAIEARSFHHGKDASSAAPTV
ncbi:MAG: hypothetical protein U1E51_12765 [Candidatus Binatia bacterium]|nr:hypothetical protein [Candidatus Binatia bacterium]